MGKKEISTAMAWTSIILGMIAIILIILNVLGVI
jgi:hypothetical protein